VVTLFLCAIPHMYNFLCRDYVRFVLPFPLPPTFVCPLPLVGSSNSSPLSSLAPLYPYRRLFVPFSYNINEHSSSRQTPHAYPFAAFPAPIPPITYCYLSCPSSCILPIPLVLPVYYSSVVNAVHLLHDITSSCNLWSFLPLSGWSQTAGKIPAAFSVIPNGTD